MEETEHKKIVVVKDETSQCPRASARAKQLPPGKIMTVDGHIIDRADACFGLVVHRDDKTLLKAADGTIYKVQPNGSLRRLSFKSHELKKTKNVLVNQGASCAK
jgi:hypothetical protein